MGYLNSYYGASLIDKIMSTLHTLVRALLGLTMDEKKHTRFCDFEKRPFNDL